MYFKAGPPTLSPGCAASATMTRSARRTTARATFIAAAACEPPAAELAYRLKLIPGLLAQILVSKYCDHVPLYRQESIYWSRHQVWLPRQTMAMWVGMAADWLRLIYEEIGQGVLSGGYVQVDETPIRYLAPGHGKTKLGYLWTCHRPGPSLHLDRHERMLPQLHVNGGHLRHPP